MALLEPMGRHDVLYQVQILPKVLSRNEGNHKEEWNSWQLEVRSGAQNPLPNDYCISASFFGILVTNREMAA